MQSCQKYASEFSPIPFGKIIYGCYYSCIIDEIVDFLEKRGKNILPPLELNYWAFICNLTPEIRHEWVKSARERKDEWRTRYSHKHTTGEPEKIIT